MKSIIVITLLLMVISTSGCLSYMSAQSSKNEIVRERVIASGDQAAIKAMNMGGAVGVGIDLLSMDTLTKHPIRQLGAAFLDALLLYGTSVGVKELNDNDKGSDVPVITINGNENNSTVIIGDGNGSNGSPIYDSQNTGM